MCKKRSLQYTLLRGKEYIGQPERRVNDTLKEDSYNLEKCKTGHLGIHCRDYDGCEPTFNSTAILQESKHKLTREITEAREIAKERRKVGKRPFCHAISKRNHTYLDSV